MQQKQLLGWRVILRTFMYEKHHILEMAVAMQPILNEAESVLSDSVSNVVQGSVVFMYSTRKKLDDGYG
jgi:hypothetical protein